MTNVNVEIKESGRKRSVGFSVRWPDTLVVSTPARLSRRELDRLIAGRIPWAERRLRILNRDYKFLGLPKKFSGGETFPYRGEEYPLTVVVSAKTGRSSCSFDGNRLTVHIPHAGDDDQPALVRTALMKWYRAQADQTLPASVKEMAARFRGSNVVASIRNQKSRWGSCTHKGKISLNWRLILLPVELADYVVWHEVCHLPEPNHSPRFWALVEEGMPDFRRRRKELKRFALYLDEM